MQTTITQPAANSFRFNKFFLAAIIALFILTAAIFSFLRFDPSFFHTSPAPISQSALEATYGLRVSLIAVTAAGGKIDLRLKMVDAAKARLLLQDVKNFPVLVTANGVVLSVSADEKPENLDYKDNRNLFLLFANTGGAVQPGTLVTLQFGETKLEPMPVK